ncbi:hypothetical protein IG193_00800 [Infirmifilum lucidum]|uniref:DUF5817 domain-containing protein n=1 Tax=Infirmifilum lucidum TaxID=2776706 RepID=A0A7L9FGT0_9CREN|nr:DUF1922 domain-containing protein [Infirmifilum lucidum]QOJ79038.1 hypothetical protein IG193_00800 [Infirmifilum lucidum]
MYVVVSCPRCGQLKIARAGTKTTQCPRCGSRFSVEKNLYTRRVFERLEDAREFLRSVTV